VREGIHVRYTGEGVREVPGVGVFQKGTVAWVPRAIALEILKEDCFVAASSGKPVQAVVLRIGQKPAPSPAEVPSGEPPPGPPPTAAPE
jgi:hypothetical protein